MSKYPPIINNLIESLSRLPGLGRKTAERFVFEFLNWPENDLKNLAENLQNLQKKIILCQQCFNLSETDPCPICHDSNRQKNIICVVSRPQDVTAIEKTGEYRGVFHVLGGTIETLDPTSVERLRFKELLARLKNTESIITEVILALDPDMAGETTSLYLMSLLRPLSDKIKVTRLARGLSLGANVEYADQITLINALKDRREV